MKKAGKKMLIIAGILLGIIALLFIVWVILSPGTIRKYDGEKSLSEKFVMEVNGAPNGFFINSVNSDNPVLLLVSSGPGSDDYVYTDKYKDMRLEEDFTVVYWDYRGMGIAYDSDIDKDSITMENLLKDTHAVTQYLKERFGKKKIYLMGFSGGTHIALRAAKEYPEDYAALINMAQTVTDSTDRDTLMYDFMKDVFTSRNDNSALKKLEGMVEHQMDGKVKCTATWIDYVDLVHDAGGGTIWNKTEFEGIILPIVFAKCYTVKEKINYIRGLKMYQSAPVSKETENFDYRVEIPQLSIPAYFISGQYDYNCPWELVQDYCSILQAPAKEFCLIPEAAHSPLWENPEVTCGILRNIKEMTSDE
ncbi:MAG: alpha/beta hydrolase [Clostridiales bacterium]|nr:alpha/beta hydrolase [Clostridiales bacterium]